MVKLASLFTVVPHTDYRRMPWKNGLGQTLEIRVQHEDNHILYRISQASVVEDGAFSDFSGLHRTLVLLKGNGVELTHQDGENYAHHLLSTPLAVACFSGGATTLATLTDGAIDDLNIMVKDEKAKSKVTPLSSPQSLILACEPTSLCTAFYANSDGEVILEANGIRHSIGLNHQDTLFIYDTATLSLNHGSGVLIQISSLV